MGKSQWKIFGMVSSLFLVSMFNGSVVMSAPVSNVWVFDGEQVPSAVYNVGGTAQTTKATQAGTDASVAYEISGGGSGTENFKVSADTSMIMTNELNSSTPAMATGYPDIAIAGLSNTAMNPNTTAPYVAVSPAPGTYTQTIEIRLTGLPLPGDHNPLILKWTIDGGVTFCTAKINKFDTCRVMSEPRFFLSEAQDYVIALQAIQGGVSSSESVKFRIAVPTNEDPLAWQQRDSDGDGIPDRVEASFDGFNPLENSLSNDRDGDLWTDFQELVRGSDLNDVNRTPIDTDWDGWSDFDEFIRGTDPCDNVMVDQGQDGDIDHVIDITCTLDASGEVVSYSPSMLDINGDGIPDFMPAEHTAFKVDADGYGAFDLAGYPDKPTASRLYEREYRLSGGIFSDSAASVRQRDMGKLTIMDSRWQLLYSQDTLPTYNELLAQNLRYTGLPAYLRRDVVGAFLASGTLTTLRVRAGAPIIVRARKIDRDDDGVLDSDDNCPDTPNPGQEDADGNNVGDLCDGIVVNTIKGWVVKGWVDNLDDVDIANFPAWMKDKAIVWGTAQDWLDAYTEYLFENLHPVDVNIALSPSSGQGVALLDGIFTWYSNLSEGALVLMGEPSSPEGMAELDALLDELGPRALNSLHADLVAQLQPGALLAGFANQVISFYSNLSIFPESTTTRAAAALAATLDAGSVLPVGARVFSALATTTSDALAAYLARLYVLLSQEELDAMSPAQRALLLNPDADFDDDGISNRMELSGEPNEITRPDLADTDGDGDSDAIDECPRDPANQCGERAYALQDTDGDGIANAFDNCRFVFNPTQKDSDSDGVGDACLDDWDGDTYKNSVELAAGSDHRNPLSIPELSKLNLVKGLNVVSFPAEVMGYGNLLSLMEELDGKTIIQSVHIFDPKRQIFIKAGYDDASGTPYGATDYPLEESMGLPGLLIYAKDKVSFTFPTTYCHEWDLLPGTNVVGSPCSKKSASETLTHIGDSSIVSGIQRFNLQTGKFDSLMYKNDGSGEMSGVDFPLREGEGYFVLMKERVEGVTP